MHTALERLAQSVDHYERGETAWDVKLARDKLAEAAPTLIAIAVEIEELCIDNAPQIGCMSYVNKVDPKRMLAIIAKHLEPLK